MILSKRSTKTSCGAQGIECTTRERGFHLTLVKLIAGIPGVEVDERAPWQSEKFIADYSAYSGPVTDRFSGSFVPGQAAEGAAAMVHD